MRVQKDGCIIVLYSISSFIPYSKIALAILLSIASTMVLAPLYIHAVKDKQDLKEACINHDEKWKNGECKFPHDNKGKKIKLLTKTMYTMTQKIQRNGVKYADNYKVSTLLSLKVLPPFI